MMPPRLLLAAPIFLFCFLAISFSQQPLPTMACGFDQIFDADRDPQIKAFDKNLRQHLSKKVSEKNEARGATAAPFVVPIVVHIVHDNGAENIANAQVFQAIQNLNDGFAAAGYFAQKGATENTQIQF